MNEERKRQFIEIKTLHYYRNDQQCQHRVLGVDCNRVASYEVFPAHMKDYNTFACDKHVFSVQQDFKREFAQWPLPAHLRLPDTQ